jgi:hypothetical protein
VDFELLGGVKAKVFSVLLSSVLKVPLEPTVQLLTNVALQVEEILALTLRTVGLCEEVLCNLSPQAAEDGFELTGVGGLIILRSTPDETSTPMVRTSGG